MIVINSLKNSMIVVQKFPSEPNSLSELLGVFRNQRFQLDSSWSYNDAAELNVHICIRGEQTNSLESILSAYLSAHNFQYVFAPDMNNLQGINLQNFVIVPQGKGQVGCDNAILSEVSLFVLLTGLQKRGGTFSLHLLGDANGLQIAASIVCQRGCVPYEVDFAFGRRFRVIASDSLSWFNFNEKEHGDLLTMPYVSAKGCSLITGFGEIAQAAIRPADSSVAIGRIFNDALARTLCFTTENFKSGTCVWGAPGYGKSTLCMHLLLQAYRKLNIIPLIIEPKKDYRRLRRLMPELIILPTLRGYNPLVPPRDCNPFDYAEVLLQLLNLATEMPPESPLPDYVRLVYYQAIADNKYGMEYFFKLYDDFMVQMGFTGEAANFCRAGRNRIATLFRIFCGKDFLAKPWPGLDVRRLLNNPTVLEIGKASTPKMASVFTYFVIAHVRMAMQSRESDDITNCLLIEEAHTVLSPMLNEGLRFDISNLIAEGRGRGLSIILSEQSPSRIDTLASNLCGNVFSFRVVSQADQEYVSHQLGIDASPLNNLRKQCVIARTNSMFQPETLHVDADKQILSLPPLANEELQTLTKKKQS